MVSLEDFETKLVRGPEDWLTANSAEKLARRIRRYWAIRGRTVSLKLRPVGIRSNKQRIYCVRSNMLDGLPPSIMAPDVARDHTDSVVVTPRDGREVADSAVQGDG